MAKRGTRFELRGTKAMQRKMKRITDTFSDAVKAELTIEAELIMTDAKQNYVPVDLGPLRSSGHVLEPERRGKDVSVDLVFGGPSAPYALRQHEDLSLQHPGGRSAKYLETPFNQAIPGMADRIAKETGAAL